MDPASTRAARAGGNVRFSRALVASTCLHAVLIGAGSALGLLDLSDGGRPVSARAVRIDEGPVSIELVEFVEEREEPVELDDGGAMLLDPDPDPVQPEPEPVAFDQERFEPPLEDEVGVEDFPQEDWSLARPPEPILAPRPARREPPPRRLAPAVRLGAVLVEGPKPDYPRLSIRLGEEGTVRCRIHITADGRVARVEVVESSGHERLDRAAAKGLLAWVFRPAEVDGQRVTSSILHLVSFHLSG